MELQDYLRVLRKRWITIVLLTVLGLAGAGVASFLMTPKYTATIQLFVSTQNTDNTAALQQGNSFAQARVQSYVNVVTTPVVLQPVVDQFRLGSVQALTGEVKASAALNTVVIEISVTDTSASRSAALANAVGQSFITAVDRLEQPPTGQGTSPVKITPVEEATAPAAPSSPRIPLNLALGLVVGLLVGIGLAVLREVLDTRVHGERELAEVTDLPVLAGITFDPTANDQPLAALTDRQGQRAESFRQLRTNLQFVDVANHPKSVVVTSSVPGEGKSTTSVNLALTLAEAGQNTILIEADLRRPQVANYLGLEGSVGLTTLLVHRAELADVLQPFGNLPLGIIAAGQLPPNPSELLGSDAMAQLLQVLEQHYDMVVIDAPPLLPVTDAAVLARRAGGLLFVVGADKVTKPEVTKALEGLKAVKATVFGAVMNLLPRKGPDAYTYEYDYRHEGDSAHPGKKSRGKSRSARRGHQPEPEAFDPLPASTRGSRKTRFPAAARHGVDTHPTRV